MDWTCPPSCTRLVEALSVLSRLGLARGFLLRRLCGLAFENLRQFTARELARMSYALARLRFLAQSNVDELVDAPWAGEAGFGLGGL